MEKRCYLLHMNETQRPDLIEVPAFYRGYVEQVKTTDPGHGLELAEQQLAAVTERISEQQAAHRYAPGKWSIREVYQHIIDCERIMAYRALCFARKDGTELPGFDEDAYAAASDADGRTFAELVHELDLVRASSIALFNSFSPAMLQRSGIANGNSISVRALGWVIAGHAMHHTNILQQRYLDHGNA